MQSSTVQDPVDKDNYPDILSINYNNMRLSELPGRTSISSIDTDRFWLFMIKSYKAAEADDILLTINDVPYVGMLAPGEFIYIPTLNDLYSITKISGLL